MTQPVFHAGHEGALVVVPRPADPVQQPPGLRGGVGQQPHAQPGLPGRPSGLGQERLRDLVNAPHPDAARLVQQLAQQRELRLALPRRRAPPGLCQLLRLELPQPVPLLRVALKSGRFIAGLARRLQPASKGGGEQPARALLPREKRLLGLERVPPPQQRELVRARRELVRTRRHDRR